MKYCMPADRNNGLQLGITTRNSCEIGPRRSNSCRRRRRRACPKNWHLPTIGIETGRAFLRSVCSPSRQRPASIAACCVPISTANASDAGDLDEVDAARAQEYTLLAALLARAPDQALLDRLATLRGDASPLGVAHAALAEAASRTNAERVEREYFNLFIGLGRGELLPYGSYYQSGFLHERPLARLREQLCAARHRARRRRIRAGRSRGDPVRDHGRTDQRTAAAPSPAPIANCSRSIFRPGSDASSPIWSKPRRPTSTAVSGTLGRLFVDIETEAFALPS